MYMLDMRLISPRDLGIGTMRRARAQWAPPLLAHAVVAEEVLPARLRDAKLAVAVADAAVVRVGLPSRLVRLVQLVRKLRLRPLSNLIDRNQVRLLRRSMPFLRHLPLFLQLLLQLLQVLQVF